MNLYETLAGQIKHQEDLKIIGEKMLEMLKDYEFKVDKKSQNDSMATLDRVFFGL